MLDDFMLDKDLNKIKMIINIEKFDDAKILIGTDDKLSGNVTIKNVILIISAINGDDKFYPQILSEEGLVAKLAVLAHFSSFCSLR